MDVHQNAKVCQPKDYRQFLENFHQEWSRKEWLYNLRESLRERFEERRLGELTKDLIECEEAYVVAYATCLSPEEYEDWAGFWV